MLYFILTSHVLRPIAWHDDTATRICALMGLRKPQLSTALAFIFLSSSLTFKLIDLLLVIWSVPYVDPHFEQLLLHSCAALSSKILCMHFGEFAELTGQMWSYSVCHVFSWSQSSRVTTVCPVSTASHHAADCARKFMSHFISEKNCTIRNCVLQL